MSYQGPIVDTHHHIWDLEQHGDGYHWIQAIPTDGKLAVLKRSYLLVDLLQDFAGHNVVQSVHVQGEYRGDPIEETRWITQVRAADASQSGFPHAIIGYVDLASPDAAAILDAHAQYSGFRGVRQQLNWHDEKVDLRAAERDYLADPTWRAQMQLVADRNLIFELHLLPHQLAAAAELAAEYPQVTFILNHVACPVERDDAGRERWQAGMNLLARQPNVACKLSGLIHPMHTSAGEWSASSLQFWVEGAIQAFSPDRCMFGSNFPVDKVCGSYADLVNAVKTSLDALALEESAQRKIFHDNAVRFYRL